MNIQKTNSGVKIYLTDAERLGIGFSLVNLLGETGIVFLDAVQKNNLSIALSESQRFVLSEFLNLLRHVV